MGVSWRWCDIFFFFCEIILPPPLKKNKKLNEGKSKYIVAELEKHQTPIQTEEKHSSS